MFAILERDEYEKVLKRIEQKDINMKMEFLGNLPFLGHWTKSQI